jgi:hypothetical protein
MSTDTAMEYAHGLADNLKSLSDDLSEGGDWTEWLEGSVLDVRRTFGATGHLLTVSLMLAFGGPNAWADFHDDESVTVRVTWYCDEQSVHLVDEAQALTEIVLSCFDARMVTA